MKLEWDINYEFRFNTFYPVNLTILFEIPIRNNKKVYMSYNLDRFEGEVFKYIVLLDTKKFIRALQKSTINTNFAHLYRGNEQNWRGDYKFHYAEIGFSCGKQNPVPVVSSISCAGRYPNCDINLSDGVTRTMWLLANDAEYIPVAPDGIRNANALLKIAGRKHCAIYPHQGLSDQWYKDYIHLLPKAPHP